MTSSTVVLLNAGKCIWLPNQQTTVNTTIVGCPAQLNGHEVPNPPQYGPTLRDTGGLRLTRFGRKVFVDHCNIDYIITLKTPISNMKQVLYMDKVLECPIFHTWQSQAKNPIK